MTAAPDADLGYLRLHVPAEVRGDRVVVGSSSRRFEPGSSRSLLRAYLGLVRELRDQRRARTIELRSVDIEALAAHLGVPGTEVVEQLAGLMGATRSQRASMVTLFGAGALVITLAGSTTVGRAASPATVPVLRGAPVSVDAPAPTVAPVDTTVPTPATTPTTTSIAPAPISAAPTAPTSAAPAPVEIPVASEPPSTIDVEPAIEQPAATSAPAPTTPVTSPPATTTTTTEAVVTDIGTPPIPPTTTEPVVTDIGTPPIPPTTAEEPILTDIGTPPIPPTTGDATSST